MSYIGNVTNTFQILTTAATTGTYNMPFTYQYSVPWQPVAAAPTFRDVVAVIPDTPESWLRQRVKEICELGVAA